MIPAYVQSFKKEQKLGFMISLFVNAFMGLVKTLAFLLKHIFGIYLQVKKSILYCSQLIFSLTRQNPI